MGSIIIFAHFSNWNDKNGFSILFTYILCRLTPVLIVVPCEKIIFIFMIYTYLLLGIICVHTIIVYIQIID